MTQTIEKVIEMKSIEIEETPQTHTEMDELLGDLNPRYFEEGMNPGEALQKIHSKGEFSDSLVRPY